MTDPPPSRVLQDVLLGELEDGEPMKALTVLKPDNDPFRIGTPAHHKMGRFVAEVLAPHLDLGQIHARGVHYLAVGGPPRPIEGDPAVYLNTETNWKWIAGAVKYARWLGYIGFERVVDERNDAPVLRLAMELRADPRVVAETGLTVDEVADLRPYVALGEVNVLQPYRIVLWGEKSSLETLMRSLALEIGADYCVGTGETSDTITYQLARLADNEGRPLVVVVIADFDPSGWQMAISIAHTLRALKELKFPDLEFQVVRAGVFAEHVREAADDPDPNRRLPSSIMKETEKRRDLWYEVWGLNQTEVDAMLVRRPAELRQAILDACEPYWDPDLDESTRRAGEAWESEAQDAVDEAVDEDRLATLLNDLRIARDAFVEVVEATDEELAEMVADVELPDFEPPEPEINEWDADPLVSSDLSFREHVERLKASKRYDEDSGL